MTSASFNSALYNASLHTFSSYMTIVTIVNLTFCMFIEDLSGQQRRVIFVHTIHIYMCPIYTHMCVCICRVAICTTGFVIAVYVRSFAVHAAGFVGFAHFLPFRIPYVHLH
jgi:hypothetical protein